MRARGRQRTDSTHVLAAIRVVNRFEEVGETVRHTLNVLAEVAPDWLYRVALPEWRERYGRRVEDYRLPEGAAAREQYAATVGADGQHLLQALDQDNEHPWLRDLAAVRVLRQVWAEHYILTPGADGTGEQVRWRTESELARPLQRIASPYDPEARYHIKRGTPWVGYKVHVTETCDESLPHLMTNVATTPASTADVAQTTPIHRTLARRQLLPQQHLVDTGYVDAGELIRAQREHGLDLLGPTPPDSSWQSQQSAALDATHFAVDWAAHQVRCPAGRQSRQWMQGADRHGNPVVKVSFSPTDCRTCPQHALCTHGHKRTLTLRPAEEHQALQAARQRQATPEFTEQYALRAGVEGTLSQGVRAFGLRRSRYVGLAKTTLQHALTATALNVVRLTDWLAGTRPERTRQSPFVQLMAPCA